MDQTSRAHKFTEGELGMKILSLLEEAPLLKASCHFLHLLPHKGVLIYVIIITNMMLAVSVRSDQVSLFASHVCWVPDCISPHPTTAHIQVHQPVSHLCKCRNHKCMTHALPHVEHTIFVLHARGKKLSRQQHYYISVLPFAYNALAVACVPRRKAISVKSEASGAAFKCATAQKHSGYLHESDHPTSGARFAFICD